MLQGHLIDILITRADNLTNWCINIDLNDAIFDPYSKEVDSMQFDLKVAVIHQITIQNIQEPYKHTVPQKIKLWWTNPLVILQLCLILQGSYCLVSLTMTTSRTKYHAKSIQERTIDITFFIIWEQNILKWGSIWQT
jgi:hypothetical protein